MKRIIPSLCIALAMGIGASAQDTTVKSKTKVNADDARTITLTGCLQQAPNKVFMLRGNSVVGSDEVTTRSRTKKDVDDDGAEVTTSTRNKVDHDGDAVGTAGLTATYELTALQGVDLSAHIGQQVQITAVAPDPKNGDDDAEISVREKTRIEREDAPDTKVRSRTEAELPRGTQSRIVVLTVKGLGSSCAAAR